MYIEFLRNIGECIYLVSNLGDLILKPWAKSIEERVVVMGSVSAATPEPRYLQDLHVYHNLNSLKVVI